MLDHLQLAIGQCYRPTTCPSGSSGSHSSSFKPTTDRHGGGGSYVACILHCVFTDRLLLFSPCCEIVIFHASPNLKL